MIALLDELKNHLPFSLLDKRSFSAIEEASQIAYYPQDSILISEDEHPKNIFLIIKGSVEAFDAEELIDIYHDHDVFGAIEIIKNEASKHQYKVSEELICYEIPVETFLQISKKNKAFKTYFFSTIMERIELIKEKNEYAKTADMMVARVDDNILHAACMVDAKTPILEALSMLEDSISVNELIMGTSWRGPASRVRIKALPSPSLLFTSIEPPNFSTIRWDIDSPNPGPPNCRVQELSA